MDFSKISVIMIVKNAELTLKECLNSLLCFDEIILVDNQSSDNTLKIAYEFKEKFPALHIKQSEFIGFGPLKNLALSYAKNDWILSIDADEVLEKECIEELKKLDLKEQDILALVRKNLYKGEWIKACGWWPDYVLRIFNKNFTKFNDNLVHESLILPSKTQKIYLQNGLKHYAFNDISHLIDKMQRYSSLWAKQNLYKQSSVFLASLKGFWTFFRNYFLKKGFLYGYKGFIISICNALGAFFKYMKLYELKLFKPKTCTLIITTYNEPKRLSLVLDSVKNLSLMPNEVIIADDGSKEDTKNLIEKYQKNFPCPLKHSWQEDKGFRAATSRNKAIDLSNYDYIILIDGDMILEKDFIKDHLKFAQRNLLLQGSRTILNEDETKDILENNDFKIVFNKKGFKNKKNNFLANLIYKFSKIDKKFFKKYEIIKGSKTCNMSFYKSDWQAIGGFNENFVGWGREDSEFVARFLFNNGNFRRLKFNALAYHIYHKENTKNMLEINHQIYLDTIKNKKIDWR
ncbi:glycosyltransferase [Campylobacter sp. 2018MI35]|uniref:glycosyltransferase family 2 protein n=1 Tax=unclassified Campylobacter TaxID=2593542 RepID=UPI0019055732|nr:MULTISPECIES: glycosyltransferase [unclassified Campylobacter]MBK1971377.1 glycosyltransferase [Campylobacter sp. TTU_617]MBK1992209.1 glycosyltransferase [Campylobacter sp. 2018MI34]